MVKNSAKIRTPLKENKNTTFKGSYSSSVHFSNKNARLDWRNQTNCCCEQRSAAQETTLGVGAGAYLIFYVPPLSMKIIKPHTSPIMQ